LNNQPEFCLLRVTLAISILIFARIITR